MSALNVNTGGSRNNRDAGRELSARQKRRNSRELCIFENFTNSFAVFKKCWEV